MRTTVRAGRLAGIPIEINLSIIGVAAFVIWTLAFRILPQVDTDASLNVRLVAAVACTALFFASILGHELGHALVARRHDVQATAITLWLLGGVAKLVRQAPTPRAEFQIAAAGPFASFLFGLGFAGAASLFVDRPNFRLTYVVLAWLGAVNILLAISNLLPAAPLDGGRVLTAALWKRLGDAERARLISARCGLILGAILIVAAVVALVWLGAITFGWVSTLVMGVFLLVAARGEIVGAAVRGRLAKLSVNELMSRYPAAVHGNQTIEQFLTTTPPGGSSVARPVVRWDRTPLGYAVPSHLAEVVGPERSWTTLGDSMIHSERVHRAWSTETAAAVLERLDIDQPGVVVVHDPESGAEIGTLSDEQLRRTLVFPDVWGRLPELVRADTVPTPA